MTDKTLKQKKKGVTHTNTPQTNSKIKEVINFILMITIYIYCNIYYFFLTIKIYKYFSFKIVAK